MQGLIYIQLSVKLQHSQEAAGLKGSATSRIHTDIELHANLTAIPGTRTTATDPMYFYFLRYDLFLNEAAGLKGSATSRIHTDIELHANLTAIPGTRTTATDPTYFYFLRYDLFLNFVMQCQRHLLQHPFDLKLCWKAFQAT
ncbi:uncharacterized protein LOC121395073 isoform X2 [Xenopus laevis]|uniref:Uncharacterized protein LOC121395073 isoform X2 n=1 Tax=Xenopus laevis TaxID=8355 RepID=A0A8J1L3I5_XENLA|nr:uncharacterized protein LOC121395073 isoform X2 [Xenopus laevis]